MKIGNIKKLLESFYDGKTSQSEELLLFNYFNSTHVPDELFEEKEFFIQLYQAEEIPIPASLEAKINDLIDDLETKSKVKPIAKKIASKRFALWTGVAASIAILISVGVYVNDLSLKGDNEALVEVAIAKKEENATKITDKEYMEAEMAMRLLSENFNKGLEQLEELNQDLEKTNKILNETFNKKNNISDEN